MKRRIFIFSVVGSLWSRVAVAVTISNADLALLRNRMAEDSSKDNFTINYTKPTINAAFQAVEVWFTSATVQAAVSGIIDASTAPAVLSPAQKRGLVRAWLDWKARNT